MSLRTTEIMRSFQGVAAGQRATLDIPIGFTYHQLFLVYSGVTLAQMTNIQIKLNGRPVWEIASGTILDLMNQFEGRAAASGILAIDFDRFGLRRRDFEELTAIGTGVSGDPRFVATFTVELDIAAGAAAPVLVAYATRSPAQPLGLIKKFRKFPYTLVVGDNEIDNLPRGETLLKVWVDLGSTPAVLTQFKVKRDNYVAIERTVALNEAIQADGVRVPQTEFVVIDPSELGFGSEEILTNVSDLRVVLTATTGGLVNIYGEYLGSIDT